MAGSRLLSLITCFGITTLFLLFSLAPEVRAQARCDVGNVCTSLVLCPQHVARVKRIREGKEPVTSYVLLQRLICGYRGNTPLLCCPSQQATARGLLPTDCGVSAQPDRIVGGKEAFLGAWPWMALLYGRESPSSEPSFFCGGSLINSRYVLTAAHCVQKGNTRLVEIVRLGEHMVSRDIDCERKPSGGSVCALRPQDIYPESVKVHSQYNPPGCRHCNDIALIRLSREARIHDFVKPVCLPVNPVRDMGFSREQFIGKYGDVAGWGSVNKSPYEQVQSDTLKQAKLQLTACNVQGVVCAVGRGQDTCSGDSGGPLMLSNTAGQKYFLVGITSLGPQVCATDNVASRYTDVYNFMGWITSNIRA